MELKPCPFCGSPQIYVTHTRYYDNEDTVSMFCNSCKSVVTVEWNEAEGINDRTKDVAVEAWNTRAERTCRRMPADEGTVVVRRGGLEMEFPYFECSECGVYVMDNARYCPWCGVKVVEHG